LDIAFNNFDRRTRERDIKYLSLLEKALDGKAGKSIYELRTIAHIIKLDVWADELLERMR